MTSIDNLKKRRVELEAEIAEAKKRLPAHSVKPPVMMMLLDLEDEYDKVLKEIDRMKSENSHQTH